MRIRVQKSQDKFQDLHVDIMFVQKQAYLVSVGDPIDLTMVDPLKLKDGQGKNAERILEVIMAHVTTYWTQGFNIKSIHSDGEGGIKAIERNLNKIGIKLITSGPNRHGVPKVDRRIRTIKERVRSIVHGLPYILPPSLLKYCVMFAVSRINLLRHSDASGIAISPKEQFTGIRTDFNTDLRIGFGDYVEVDAKSTDNTLKERSNSAIALLPTGNINGSIKFFILKNQSIVSRERWTPIQIPDTAIRTLNAITLEETSEPTRDVSFEQGVGRSEVLCDQPEPAPPPINNNREALLPEAMLPEIPAPEESPPATEEIQPPQTTPVEAQPTEWSSRLRDNPRQNPKYFVNHMSVKKATQLHGDKARDAVKAELNQMVEKEVWTPVHRTEGMKTIPSSIFLKEKFKDDGNLDKIKARLVAGGHRQETPTSPTAAPTVTAESIRLTLAHAAVNNKRIVIVDVTGAFLNARMNEEVFMDIRGETAEILVREHREYEEYLRADGTITVKLTKALYGLKQSAYLWYEEIRSTLTRKCNLTTSRVDRCVFFNQHTWITLHVDDLMIVSDDDADIERIKLELTNTYESITVKEGDHFKYLGVDIKRTPETIKMSMEEYVTKVTHGVTTTSRTPADHDLFKVTTNVVVEQEQQDELRSTVAKLLFIATHSRPDILVATNFLCGRAERYTAEDEEKVKRILQYLKGSPKDGITLRGVEEYEIEVYADASFGTHTEDCYKSHSGLVILVGKNPIVMKTNKQKLVTRSSCEAELVSASDAIPMMCYIKEWLEEKGKSVPKPNLLQDNMSTISLIKSEMPGTTRSRHIAIRYFFIRDRVKSGEIEVNHCPTKLMIADILTKPLEGILFKQLKEKMMGGASAPEL
jgi:hypothetical protein